MVGNIAEGIVEFASLAEGMMKGKMIHHPIELVDSHIKENHLHQALHGFKEHILNGTLLLQVAEFRCKHTADAGQQRSHWPLENKGEQYDAGKQQVLRHFFAEEFLVEKAPVDIQKKIVHYYTKHWINQ